MLIHSLDIEMDKHTHSTAVNTDVDNKDDMPALAVDCLLKGC